MPLTVLTVLAACDANPPANEPAAAAITVSNEKANHLDSASTAGWIASHSLHFDATSLPESVLQALLKRIDERRMVMLGEAEYGAPEQARLKVQLVRALHERQGFDVLAMDGPMWECTPVLNPALAYDDALADGCIFPVWKRNDETRALFAYVASTQSTSRPLVLVGVDVFRLRSSAAERRAATWATMVASADARYAREVFQLDSTFYEVTEEANRRLMIDRIGGWLPRDDSLHATLRRSLWASTLRVAGSAPHGTPRGAAPD